MNLPVTFQYQGVPRIEEHESMIIQHLHSVFKHNPNITHIDIHISKAHAHAIKIRLDAHLPPKHHFSDQQSAYKNTALEASVMLLIQSLNNWLLHLHEKSVDHGHTAGHPFQ